MFCDRSSVITCWRFNGTSVERVADPEFWHDQGAMTHWNEDPIVIGGYGIQVETFNGTLQWNREEDLPATDPEWTYIEYQSAVNFKNHVYVFGGRFTDYLRRDNAQRAVFQFNGSWTRIQNLAGVRYGHRQSCHSAG